jgi:hypothetical protein
MGDEDWARPRSLHYMFYTRELTADMLRRYRFEYHDMAQPSLTAEVSVRAATFNKVPYGCVSVIGWPSAA